MTPRIRLRDLRYYVLTGATVGGINAVFAFGPKLIKSFWFDATDALWRGGPLVPYWLLELIYFPVGVALCALIGVLFAVPAGYFQLRRFRRRLAAPESPRCPEARAPQSRLPQS